MIFGFRISDFGFSPPTADGLRRLANGGKTQNPPTTADVVQGSCEVGAHEPPAGGGASRRPQGASNSKLKIQNSVGGFTLIELIVVVAIIGILATIALPAMQNAPVRAREAVIRADLYQMRSCIDQYLADKGVYPDSLQTLVDAGYLRFLPADPFTHTADGAWEEIYAEADQAEELAPFEDEFGSGTQVIDVRYADTSRVALDGSLISEW